jgi:formate dehydrogenase subunit gamma
MVRMIRKENGFNIVNHWVLAVSCILLAVSGYGFLFKVEGIGSLFGGFPAMRIIHNWIGIAFLVSLFLSLFMYLKESLTFNADDIGWIKVAGGYLSHKAQVPPMGKINTGQKFYYIGLVVFGFGISVSGFLIWIFAENRQWLTLSHLFYNICFMFFIVMVPVHIYLGTFANPGTLRIMISGRIPYTWAKKKYPKWIAEVEGRGERV